MPLMIKLNRNIMKVDLCLDNGHFITVFAVSRFVFALLTCVVKASYCLVRSSFFFVVSLTVAVCASIEVVKLLIF